MTVDWDLLGGNPAPGSAQGVQGIAAGFGRAADRVSQVRAQILDVTRSGGDGWTGKAAEAFTDLSGTLPAPLQHALDSFQEAATALRRYATELADAQADAQRLAANAAVASDEAATARTRHRAAADHLAAAKSRVATATTALRTARRAEQAGTDPTQAPVLAARTASAGAALSSATADRDAAQADADRHARDVAEAADRLATARRAAELVRERVREAAGAAIGSLQEAQKAGDLPNWWSRGLADTGEWFQQNGDAIADNCRTVAGICGLLALLIPGGGVLFLAFAAVFSLVTLVMDVGVAASSRDGFTADRLWTIAGDALMTVASATGAGALLRAGRAGEAAVAGARAVQTVSQGAGYAQDAASVGRGYAQGGWAGAGWALGGVLVGRAGGQALPAVLGKLNKNPAVANALKDLSAMTRKAATTDLPGMQAVHVPGYSETVGAQLRLGQSILGHGHIPPGGFMPGHGAPATAGAHATARAVTTAGFSALYDGLGKPVVDWLLDKAQTTVNEVTR